MKKKISFFTVFSHGFFYNSAIWRPNGLIFFGCVEIALLYFFYFFTIHFFYFFFTKHFFEKSSQISQKVVFCGFYFLTSNYYKFCWVQHWFFLVQNEVAEYVCKQCVYKIVVLPLILPLITFIQNILIVYVFSDNFYVF